MEFNSAFKGLNKTLLPCLPSVLPVYLWDRTRFSYLIYLEDM